MKEINLFTTSGTRKYLVQAERLAFLEAASQAEPDVRLLCELLAYTGCRLSEALRIQPCHIDLGTKAVTFRTLKQRKRVQYRQVPIPDDLLSRLNVWVQCKPFCNQRLFPVHRQTGWRWVEHTMSKAGIVGEYATSRGLRHGFAIATIQAGVPQTILQKWLGHASLRTTAIYSNVVGKEERHLAEQVWFLAA